MRRRAAIPVSGLVCLVLLLPACSRGGGPALPIPVPLRHHQRGSLEPCAPALGSARAEAQRVGRGVVLRAVRRTTYPRAVRLVRDAGGVLPPPSGAEHGDPRARNPSPSARPSADRHGTGRQTPPPAPTADRRTATPSPAPRAGADPGEVCVFAFHGDFAGGRDLAVVVTERHPRVLAAVATRRPVSR